MIRIGEKNNNNKDKKKERKMMEVLFVYRYVSIQPITSDKSGTVEIVWSLYNM